jgi:hypothetical protein
MAQADPTLRERQPWKAASEKDQLECAYAPMVELLVLHDDAEREFGYSAGAQQALEQAGPAGWTTVSVRDDRATVF